MFDAMAIIGGCIVCVPCLILFLYFLKRQHLAFSKPLLLLLILTGFLSLCAIEFGWILTEVGRQPFIIRGIMKTADAFTTNKTVMAFSFIYPLLYVILFIATGYTLVRHYKKVSHG
jgi:cytochrome d ubiquinol oxidase subunit I